MKRHICGIAAALLVIGFQLLLLYPLHQTLDLPLWDESTYMGRGANWIAGISDLGGISGSPLYVGLYGVVVELVGRLSAIFVMSYGLVVAVTVLLFVFLRQQLHSLPMAVFLTAVWAVSLFNLTGFPQISGAPLVYRFALLLFLGALICVRHSRVLALLLLLFAGMARLEYIFLAVPYALYLLVRLVVQRRRAGTFVRKPPSKPVLLVTAVLAPAFVVLALNVPEWELGGLRSWFAFQQHYAVGEVEEGRFSGLEPWSEYPTVIAEDFPTSHSLREALAENPEAFISHLLRNLRRVPDSLLSYFQPVHHLVTPILYLVVIAGIFGVCLALLSSPRAWLSRARKLLVAQGDLLFLTLLVPMSLLPSLIVTANPQYLLMAMPFLFLYVGLVYKSLEQTFHEERTVLRGATWPSVLLKGAPLLAALGVGVVAVAGPRPFQAADKPRHIYNNVAEMMSIWPDEQVQVLGTASSSYENYVGRQRFIGIEPSAVVTGAAQTGDTGLLAQLALHQPDAVLAPLGEREALRGTVLDTWSAYDLSDSVIYFRPVQSAANGSR